MPRIMSRSQHRHLLAAAGTSVLLTFLACSHVETPFEPPPPAYTTVGVDWTQSSVAFTPDGFSYVFGFAATAEFRTGAVQADGAGRTAGDADSIEGLSFEWSVDRLLPAERRVEIAPTQTREGIVILPEPGDLEDDALLVLTVQARTPGLVSPPISLVYGRGLIGPRSRITSPSLPEGRGPSPLPVTLGWSAWDEGPVLSNSAASPASFGCKLISVERISASEEEILAHLETEPNLLIEDRESPGWTVLPADRHTLLNRRSASHFAFAVRAVGPDGHRERLELGRNVILGTYRPTIFSFGHLVASGEEFSWSPDDEPIRVARVEGSAFELSWDEMIYCRYAAGPNEGDLDELGGWAWRNALDAPLVLPARADGTESEHLFLHVRPTSHRPETELRVHLQIDLLSAERHGFLIVDDSISDLWAETDLDAHDVGVLGARFAELGSVDRFDPDDEPIRASLPPGALAPYEGVLWHVHYASGTFWSSRLARSLPAIQTYLRSGGRLFLVGGPLSDLLRDGVRIVYQLPKDPPGIEDPEESTALLAAELGMRDVLVGVPTEGASAGHRGCGLVGAEPITAALPRLDLDTGKWDPFAAEGGEYRGGIPFWEGLWRESGWLDSPVGVLYHAATFDTTRRSGAEPCDFRGAAIAFRNVIPPTPGSPLAEGRVVVFDFETYVFAEEGIADAARSAIDWLMQ